MRTVRLAALAAVILAVAAPEAHAYRVLDPPPLRVLPPHPTIYYRVLGGADHVQAVLADVTLRVWTPDGIVALEPRPVIVGDDALLAVTIPSDHGMAIVSMQDRAGGPTDDLDGGPPRISITANAPAARTELDPIGYTGDGRAVLQVAGRRIGYWEVRTAHCPARPVLPTWDLIDGSFGADVIPAACLDRARRIELVTHYSDGSTTSLVHATPQPHRRRTWWLALALVPAIALGLVIGAQRRRRPTVVV